MSDLATPRPLLVELFVEELPPKSLRKLADAFAAGVARSLEAQSLVDAPASATPFATPRRLAVRIDSVRARAPEAHQSTKLMPTGVGLDASGRATPALLKKLASIGADATAVPALARRADGKGEALFLDRVVAGAALAEGLQRALDAAIAALPIEKWMTYQLADGWTSVSFVRPAHALVALHGDEIVPIRALGLDAGRTTRGHRFEGSRVAIEIASAASYERQLLDEGSVIASFAARRAEIVRQLGEAARDAKPVDDDALLDEVTGLVEQPHVVACEFEREFLAVPPECLVLTMKANQRYFPLYDRAGALTSRFLVVANVAPADPRRIVEGNERVVRPRLADAKFFYDKDRQRTLASRVPELDKVVYHARLGSQGERVARLRAIARWVGERIGADVAPCDRAALLAKADLLTDMVGEFPELQGVMGRYYALHDGEGADVAEAIGAQYVNARGDGDAQVAPVAAALLLADRTETLVGIWGIGLRPTGEKDPYALRRHALTVLATFASLAATSAAAGTALRLDLRELLEFAASTFVVPLAAGTVDEVEAFVRERYANQLAQRFDARAVAAVMAQRPPLHETLRRLEAVRDFQGLAEATALAAANKRVGNILRKSEATAKANALDAARLVEPEEIGLHEALGSVGRESKSAFEAGDYAASLRVLARLREPVDAFFERVMVNVDDPALRDNRLALLAELHGAMNRVADLASLAA